jgi:Uma2 family endonuclease
VLADQSGILDASAVLLVAEIVSPRSRAIDRLTKPPLYAQAGIPSLWRVELEEGPSVFAYRLEDGHYVEVAWAEPGHVLTVDQPFPLSLDPASLRP